MILLSFGAVATHQVVAWWVSPESGSENAEPLSVGVNRATHNDSGASATQLARTDSMGHWLTVSEVAAHIHVSRDTVERWIHAGLLRAVDVGIIGQGSRRRSYWRISSESIENFIASRANKPPLPSPPAVHRRPVDKKQGVIEFIK